MINQLLKCNILTFSLVREVTGVNVNMRVLLSFNDGGHDGGDVITDDNGMRRI